MKQKLEKALEYIGYVFITAVSLLVLTWGFRFLWEAGKSIWKTLSK